MVGAMVFVGMWGLLGVGASRKGRVGILLAAACVTLLGVGSTSPGPVFDGILEAAQPTEAEFSPCQYIPNGTYTLAEFLAAFPPNTYDWFTCQGQLWVCPKGAVPAGNCTQLTLDPFDVPGGGGGPPPGGGGDTVRPPSQSCRWQITVSSRAALFTSGVSLAMCHDFPWDPPSEGPAAKRFLRRIHPLDPSTAEGTGVYSLFMLGINPPYQISSRRNLPSTYSDTDVQYMSNSNSHNLNLRGRIGYIYRISATHRGEPLGPATLKAAKSWSGVGRGWVDTLLGGSPIQASATVAVAGRCRQSTDGNLSDLYVLQPISSITAAGQVSTNYEFEIQAAGATIGTGGIGYSLGGFGAKLNITQQHRKYTPPALILSSGGPYQLQNLNAAAPQGAYVQWDTLGEVELRAHKQKDNLAWAYVWSRMGAAHLTNDLDPPQQPTPPAQIDPVPTLIATCPHGEIQIWSLPAFKNPPSWILHTPRIRFLVGVPGSPREDWRMVQIESPHAVDTPPGNSLMPTGETPRATFVANLLASGGGQDPKVKIETPAFLEYAPESVTVSGVRRAIMSTTSNPLPIWVPNNFGLHGHVHEEPLWNWPP